MGENKPKKILITGKDSYLGTSLEKWLQQWPADYVVETIDMIGDEWRNSSFTVYDVIFHVAGIAHVKEIKENKGLYYKVNRDLAYETARKAKGEGIRQFVLLSSMSVYGIENGMITKNSPLNPKTNYGKSKLEAEQLIRPLEDDTFRVAILRPPMVYGKNCKGNYSRLAGFAVKMPVFPNMDNKRSMIYINNLCEFVRLLIDDCSSGLFFPQNKEYVKTSEIVKLIAEVHEKRIRLTKVFNPVLKVMGLKIGIVNKVFGNLVYEQSLSEYKENYRIRNLRESIMATESGDS